MNWYVVFYLFSVADAVKYTTLGFAIVLSIISFVTFILHQPADDSSNRMSESGINSNRRILRFSFVMAICLWLTFIVIPSRKDMLMIIAGGAVGQFIIHNKDAKAIPADITRFLRKEILDATADLDVEETVKGQLGIKTKADSLKEMSKEQLIKLLTEEK